MKKKIVVLVLLVLFSVFAAQSETGYQKPPNVVLDILNGPAFPQILVSPSRHQILLIDNVRHPSISELAKPILRLAGSCFEGKPEDCPLRHLTIGSPRLRRTGVD